MVRMQVYLTEQQQQELAAIAKATRKRQSELVREAVARFLDEEGTRRRQAVLKEAAGLWKNRKDLPDFKAIRAEWDRA